MLGMIMHTGSMVVQRKVRHGFCPQEVRSIVGKTDTKELIGTLLSVPGAHTLEEIQ